MDKIRKLPPVCLLIALAKIITGNLKLSKEYLGAEVKNQDGYIFWVFRNIKTQNRPSTNEACVFVVSFKFAHLSFSANKITSMIPMLLIAGFPGFIQKLYAYNPENGYWQGMYEWKSKQDLEAYKKSFVFRMMNKRAIKNSITTFVLADYNLSYFMDAT